MVIQDLVFAKGKECPNCRRIMYAKDEQHIEGNRWKIYYVCQSCYHTETVIETA